MIYVLRIDLLEDILCNVAKANTSHVSFNVDYIFVQVKMECCDEGKQELTKLVKKVDPIQCALHSFFSFTSFIFGSHL